MSKIDDEITKLMIAQARHTAYEIANFCDQNRGHLAVGDMLRQIYGITPDYKPNQEEKKPTLTLVKKD